MTARRFPAAAFVVLAFTRSLLAQTTPPDGSVAGPPEPKPPVTEADGAKAGPPAAAAPPAWYQAVKVGAFVDAYFSHNVLAPKPSANGNRFRAFDQHDGFNVTWAGLDLSTDPEPVGFTVQLRFGSGTPSLAHTDAANAAGGLGYAQQAFVSFKASEKLTFVVGKFDTLYGHEVPQSQLNINYTRGALFNLGQPFFHTGLRADYQATKALVVKLLLVNGWDASVDNNAGKSAGVSIGYASDAVAVTLGYLGGPEQADTGRVVCPPNATLGAGGICTDAMGLTTEAGFGAVEGANTKLRHLVDLILDTHPTRSLRVVLDGTYVTEQHIVDPVSGKTQRVGWHGGALFARQALGKTMGIGVRGEYFVDDKASLLGAKDASGAPKAASLKTGTLTLDASPWRNLLFKLDARLDSASEKVFAKGVKGTAKEQITTTLGVVATTN